MEIGVGIGYIVKITGDELGVRTTIELRSYYIGLAGAQCIAPPQLFDDGFGSRHDAVIRRFNDLQVPIIGSPKQDRLQVRGIYPDAPFAHLHIGCNQTFGSPQVFRSRISNAHGIYNRITAENGGTCFETATPYAVINGPV